jgi:hypothetical protein
VWWRAVTLMALVQPSSAAAERVFSVLKSFFSHLQTRTYTDVIELALFLKVNGRKLGEE